MDDLGLSLNNEEDFATRRPLLDDILEGWVHFRLGAEAEEMEDFVGKVGEEG